MRNEATIHVPGSLMPTVAYGGKRSQETSPLGHDGLQLGLGPSDFSVALLDRDIIPGFWREASGEPIGPRRAVLSYGSVEAQGRSKTCLGMPVTSDGLEFAEHTDSVFH